MRTQAGRMAFFLRAPAPLSTEVVHIVARDACETLSRSLGADSLRRLPKIARFKWAPRASDKEAAEVFRDAFGGKRVGSTARRRASQAVCGVGQVDPGAPCRAEVSHLTPADSRKNCGAKEDRRGEVGRLPNGNAVFLPKRVPGIGLPPEDDDPPFRFLYSKTYSERDQPAL